MAKLITLQLIETSEARGKGTPDDVCRLVKQWYTPDGTLVLEYDPCEPKISMVESLLDHLTNHG